MANELKISKALASLMVDAITDEFNNGYLRIYYGTKPTDLTVAISTQTLLAELRYNATAFGAAVDGVATANALTADTSANASQTAQFFRAFKSNGTTALIDGTVGTSGCDLNMNAIEIVAGAKVEVTSHTLTHPLA